MNFQNFYTLIFNPKITTKNYVIFYIFIIIALLFLSFVLNRLNFDITDNDVVKNYQLSKINSKKFETVDTIIVGDSSSGNSMNSAYFDKLSGLKSENLSLTGSWGIVGSLGIAQKAYEKNKKIKNIIIIQTLDIWNRSFSKESILELFSFSQIFKNLNKNSIIGYYFNPKEIWWHLKFIKKELFDSGLSKQIDLNNDYLLQKKDKYSNGKSIIKEGTTLDNIKISDAKLHELNMLENFCKKNSLNCIFLNGPIHNDIIKNSSKFITYLNSDIKNQFSYMKYYPEVFSYKNYKMGDSHDHMDVKYKNEATLNYYNLIKRDLGR